MKFLGNAGLLTGLFTLAKVSEALLLLNDALIEFNRPLVRRCPANAIQRRAITLPRLDARVRDDRVCVRARAPNAALIEPECRSTVARVFFFHALTFGETLAGASSAASSRDHPCVKRIILFIFVERPV